MQLREPSGLKVSAARTADLVTTESKGEVLVYDQTVHHIHHLNAAASAVWRLCDGKRTVSDIAADTGITEDAVKLALRTLEDARLLDGPLETTIRGTQSRRSFLKKAAVAGAVPAIVSVTAPIAAAASSSGTDAVCGKPCRNNGDCNGGPTCNHCSNHKTSDSTGVCVPNK